MKRIDGYAFVIVWSEPMADTSPTPEQIADALSGLDVNGPDADGFVWLVLNPTCTPAAGAVNLGAKDRIVAQVALLWKEQRDATLSALRAGHLVPASSDRAGHPALDLYAWLRREYANANPLSGEAFEAEARPLVAALADFIVSEAIEGGPVLSASSASTGWRPIAEAPRDGTVLLLGRWEDTGFAYDIGWYEAGVADQCWYGDDGQELFPTHFQPLPTPPAESGRPEEAR